MKLLRYFLTLLVLAGLALHGSAQAGCTNPTSCNYDPTATTDDGTCCFWNCATLTMTDAFGDGWSGAEILITYEDGSLLGPYTVQNAVDGDNTSIGIVYLDIPTGCYQVSVSEDFYPSEVSWQITGCDGALILSGGANENQEFALGDGAFCPVFGCTDGAACNYDPAATDDDGSCILGGVAAVLTVTTDFLGSETSWTMTNLNTGDVLQQSSAYGNNVTETTTICLEANACYTFSFVDAFGDGGASFVFEYWDATPDIVLPSGTSYQTLTYTICTAPAGCTDASACNYDASISLDDGTCDFVTCVGCTDATACNYDVLFTQDDGSCYYPDACGICPDPLGEPGCTDPLACNYNSAAIVPDGSCSYTDFALKWDKTIGASLAEFLVSGGVTGDGGYWMFGQSNSAADNDKSDPGFATGNYDWWMVKLDANRNVVWDVALGGDGADSAGEAIALSDGGFLLVGGTQSSVSGDVADAPIGSGSDDAWAVKLDANGVIVWQKRLGGTAFDRFVGAVEQPDGTLVLAGVSASATGPFKAAPAYGDIDYWMVGMDASGNVTWEQTYGGDASDGLWDVASTSDGGLIVVGASSSGATGTKTSTAYNTNGTSDVWCIKTDDQGLEQWQLRFGTTSTEQGHSVMEHSNGEFWITGDTSGGGELDFPDTAFASNDAYVARVSSAGSLIDTELYADDSNDYGRDLYQHIDGVVYLSVYTWSGSGPIKTEDSYGFTDIWLLELNTDLSIAWQRTIGGNSVEFDALLSLDHSGDILVSSGSYSDPNFFKSEPAIGSDPDYWMFSFNRTPDSGCTDPAACNYDPFVNCDDGSCDFTSCYGCQDPAACNYDDTAVLDDCSCDYTSCVGCTDAAACNYDPAATEDDGSCQLPDGCTDSTACNYDPAALCDDGSCSTAEGCTDAMACNYDAMAVCDDGTCVFPGDACDDGIACTENDVYTADCGCAGTPNPALCDDGQFCNGQESCDPLVGCLPGTPVNVDDGDPCTTDYCDETLDVIVNEPLPDSDMDGVCDAEEIPGCDDPTACNYDPVATDNDGSCILVGDACDDGDALTFNDEIQADCSCSGMQDDSDGDGIGDSDEVNIYGTDPFNNDTDGDGLSDSVEINLSGTNPLLTDTDMDGCGDAEFFGGLCGTVCAEDLNGDGTIGTSDILQLLSVFGTMCP